MHHILRAGPRGKGHKDTYFIDEETQAHRDHVWSSHISTGSQDITCFCLTQVRACNYYLPLTLTLNPLPPANQFIVTASTHLSASSGPQWQYCSNFFKPTKLSFPDLKPSLLHLRVKPRSPSGPVWTGPHHHYTAPPTSLISRAVVFAVPLSGMFLPAPDPFWPFRSQLK